MAQKFLKLFKRQKRRIKSKHAKRRGWDLSNTPEIEKRVSLLVKKCEFKHVKVERIFCYSSQGASTRAYARIWGLGRIWQQTLEIEPAYIIEVISEKFEKLPKDQQDMVLIHELLHIPKSFSGALVPHKKKGGVNNRVVQEIYRNLVKEKI